MMYTSDVWCMVPVRAGVQAGAYWMLSPDEVHVSNHRTTRAASARRPYVPVWLSPVVCPPSPSQRSDSAHVAANYCPCKPR